MSGLGQTPLSVSCGADSSFPGGEDGTPDPQRTKQAIAQLQQKILKLTEQIKIEQTARDDNVAEYLKLANNADKQQSTRIKQVKDCGRLRSPNKAFGGVVFRPTSMKYRPVYDQECRSSKRNGDFKTVVHHTHFCRFMQDTSTTTMKEIIAIEQKNIT